ncbi:MAG TPA: DUF4861 family protein [Opitutaceae bacterium]|nr:DUF4861 family protein [Opitutaceae bacterium]
MKPSILAALALLLAAPAAAAGAAMKVTVSHDLDIARPAETITVPWSEVAKHLPGALLQKIAVKDPAGRVLPYQVTNIAPQAKDPEGRGLAYGDLIFQHDFAAGEKTATFTVEKIEDVAPVFPTKAFARHVPERLDDFAWENDRIGHRTYGAALAAPAPAGVTKEVLVTSGLDVWCKRVGYPIVDRWYNKGHDHYHTDQGEGMDMFQVGPSRGCGGTGIWDGSRLHVSGNFQSWRILANGPVRAIFELTYGTWAADGVYVSEVKRFTVDAGHNLDRVESTFHTVSNVKELTVAVGLNKNPADRGQEPAIGLDPRAGDGSFTQWIAQKSNGQLGTAVVVPGPEFSGFAEDARNHLVLAKVAPGRPLVYYAGAGWDRSGQFKDRAAWESYVADAVARARAPVRVSLAPAS